MTTPMFEILPRPNPGATRKIFIEDSVWERVKTISQDKGVSVDEGVRQAVDFALDYHKADDEIPF